MFQIKILSVGKTKELWLEEAIKTYVKRLQGLIDLQTVWAKSDDQLVKLVSAEKAERNVICLDVKGREFSSTQFSQHLIRKLEQGGSRLTFVIGGPQGLPPDLRNSKYDSISLSRLTLTHQMVRLLLVEQIYRAMQIAQGKPYHK